MLTAAVTGLQHQIPLAVPFLMLFSVGFLYVGWISYRHSFGARSVRVEEG